jgi:hypothetical protein
MVVLHLLYSLLGMYIKDLFVVGVVAWRMLVLSQVLAVGVLRRLLVLQC